VEEQRLRVINAQGMQIDSFEQSGVVFRAKPREHCRFLDPDGLERDRRPFL
jgi:hypothetical protein